MLDFGLKLKKLTIVGILASAVSLTACSTTSVVKVSEGAPITYKLGEGNVQYASASTKLPRSSQLPHISQHTSAAPTVAVPSPYVNPQPVAPRPKQSRPEVDNFDQKRVDKDLYKHQKVGKKYSMMGKKYTPKHEPRYDEKGLASWYGDKYHGKPTATGEVFNKNALTAAHKTLPLNSMLHVQNMETGKSIMVRLNDRGPFVKGRIIDLSEAAARELGVIQHGTVSVRVRYAGPADPMAATRMVDAPRPAQPVPYQPVSPQPVPTPQSVAVPQPLAAPSNDSYRPLRDYTPRSTAPQEYAPLTPAQPAPRTAEQPLYEGPQYPAPQYEPFVPKHMTPQAPVALPNDPAMMNDGANADDTITLTIKGPIHMAKTGSSNDARWINAVNVQNNTK